MALLTVPSRSLAGDLEGKIIQLQRDQLADYALQVSNQTGKIEHLNRMLNDCRHEVDEQARVNLESAEDHENSSFWGYLIGFSGFLTAGVVLLTVSIVN